MQTDELRAELAELAREVDPFPEELGAIRKRVARRRAAQVSVAAVLIVGLIAGVVATTRSDGDHLQVAGRPKRVSINLLPRIDALVAVPPSANSRVASILDSTDAVRTYAEIPASAFTLLDLEDDGPFGFPKLAGFVRAHRSATILGVELDRSIGDRMQQLTAAVGSAATVGDFATLKGQAIHDDVEIFMTVKACADQIDAVRAALAGDPDVESYRFISKTDALAEFRKLFEDEPSLLENTTADALPVSFRVRLREGVLPPAFARRYIGSAGVRGINAAANPFGEMPSRPETTDQPACTPNP